MTPPTNRALSAAELAALQLPGWTIVDDKLTTVLSFDSVASAVAAYVEIMFHAERLNHHPEVFAIYDRLEIGLASHDLGGISQHCVELARAVDAAAARAGATRV